MKQMAAKSDKKKDSIYITNFDTIRPFLRLFSYGCYHRSLFPKFGLKTGTYDKHLAFMQFCLSRSHFTYSATGKTRRYHFRGDMYHTSENYLAPLFYMRAIDRSKIFSYICIYHILASAGRPLSVGEIQNKVGGFYYPALHRIEKEINALPQADPKRRQLEAFLSSLAKYNEETQIRRRLASFLRAGILTQEFDKKTAYYTLAVNPFKVLSPAEIRELREALSFYQHVGLLTMPGSYVSETLSPFAKKDPFPVYQFKNVNFSRCIDDLTASAILTAIGQERDVSFLYKGKKTVVARPLQIRTDFTYNRQYVLAQTDRGAHAYRLDNISGVKVLETARKLAPTRTAPPKLREIKLRLFHSSPDLKMRLCRRLRSRFPDAAPLEDEAETSLWILPAQDTLHVLPWIRTFHPNAEIVSDSSGKLRSRMKADIEEALGNYGIIL